MREGSQEKTEKWHAGSRVLHAVDRLAARPTIALGVVSADLVWVLYSALVGFPARLEIIFQTLVAATTLAMVFVIQLTATRAGTHAGTHAGTLRLSRRAAENEPLVGPVTRRQSAAAC